jgi:quinol-cytochrome oxidoreductase complex cytochrome b subunit/mono/diheme cytochrome c family protein
VTTETKHAAAPSFWEERTGWRQLKGMLLLEPLPGGARWAAAFGSLLLFSFLVQVITGILLSMNYAPSVDTAYPSVQYIQDEVPTGSFIRAVHHWGSSAMVVLLLVHLVQVFVWGAYKRPREFTWMVGVLLLFCTLGLAFTGYLLPWDQKAYWATKVGLGIAGTIPGIGDGLRTLLQGGPQLGNLTLTRFFTIHGFILPGLVILLVFVHLYLFRRHGVTPPWWQSEEQLKARQEPFWPRQAWKDGVLALVFLVGLGLWAYQNPAPLESQADPSQPYEARPEWYFMFLFKLLQYFKGPYEVVGTFVLPATFALLLLCWPFLDRNPLRSPSRRPIAMTLLGGSTAALIGLTIFAIATDVRMQEPAQAVAQQPPPPAPVGALQQLDVAMLYGTHCAACHDVDGSGKVMRAALPTVPDFTSAAWQGAQTNLEIVHRIVDGNPPLMPAFRDKLSSDQSLALTIYVRAFAIESGKPAPVAKVGQETPAPPPKLPASDGRQKAGQEPTPSAAQMSTVQLYRAYCMACHDLDGKGKIVRIAMKEIPDFSDATWQTAHKDEEIKNSILAGKGKFMLPMRDKLSAADAEKMVAYVRAFGGAGQVVPTEPSPPLQPPTSPIVKPAIEPRSATVPKKEPPRLPVEIAEAAERTRAATMFYRQYCLSCHGADGRGAELRSSMPALPDFTSRIWQEGQPTARLAVSILDGKGTLMPAFRGRVSESAAHDLAAYVRAFGPARPEPSQPASSEFEQRFRELEQEWNELQRQLRELSTSRRKE